MSQRSVLVIYTGGTIGMVLNQSTGSLQPLNFDQICHYQNDSRL